MRASFLGFGLVLAVWVAPSTSTGQPATDIYLGSLSLQGGGIRVAGLRNITHRNGYDNQPHFTPDGLGILYTSIRDDGQADTYRYDLATGAVRRITYTEESEYSPLTIPGAATFSVVRVEADSTQRLWHFDLDGEERGLLLEKLEPVGYHAWYDRHTVATFVLGEPPTLQIADLSTGRVEIVARDIGRSLQIVPSRGTLSFVQKTSDEDWSVVELDLETRQKRRLVSTLTGSEDFAWTPGGLLLMGRGSALYQWDPGGDRLWELVADFETAGLERITRIAVSPAGDHIAIVAVPGADGE